MLLFAMCINPLLINLDNKLTGLNIRRNSTKTTAIAYADDITIVITQPEGIDTIQEILHDYMHATGARINTNKSRAIALGSWNKSTPVMDITYHDKIKILGFHMTSKIQQSANKSWALLTAKIRAQAQEAYHRALNLEHRIRHVNSFFLDRAWFTMQIFPPPTDFVRQMNIAISWFLWKGAVFRVPLSTLLRPKELGGRALTHITAKCMTLFMLRMEKQGQRIDTFTEKWLTQWRLHRRTPNPPLIKRIPTKFDYLSIQRRIGICADEKNP